MSEAQNYPNPNPNISRDGGVGLFRNPKRGETLGYISGVHFQVFKSSHISFIKISTDIFHTQGWGRCKVPSPEYAPVQ